MNPQFAPPQQFLGGPPPPPQNYPPNRSSPALPPLQLPPQLGQNATFQNISLGGDVQQNGPPPPPPQTINQQPMMKPNQNLYSHGEHMAAPPAVNVGQVPPPTVASMPQQQQTNTAGAATISNQFSGGKVPMQLLPGGSMGEAAQQKVPPAAVNGPQQQQQQSFQNGLLPPMQNGSIPQNQLPPRGGPLQPPPGPNSNFRPTIGGYPPGKDQKLPVSGQNFPPPSSTQFTGQQQPPTSDGGHQSSTLPGGQMAQQPFNNYSGRPPLPGQAFVPPPQPQPLLPGQSGGQFLQQSSAPGLHHPPMSIGQVPSMQNHHHQTPLLSSSSSGLNATRPPLEGGQLPPLSGPVLGQQPQFNNNMPPFPPGVVPPQNPPRGMNQVNNQMQGLNLSGGGGRPPYPGMPQPQQQQSGVMNGGDIGSHMMPPMPPLVNQQQQYINGQPQMRPSLPPGPGGYPPMPGQQQLQQPGVGGPYAPYQQQQQQQQNKKLDPDQMPNPIQVTEDDRRNRSGVFCTNEKGLVPPLVTTNFVVNDQGNASPRFIRSTMYSVPITQDMMKQSAIPFSLVISPMARTVDNEYPLQIVNFGDLGPVRCIRCKAYMCPYMQFIDSGRRFQCLFCKATTDVPAEYFQHLDQTGQRMDRYERPELVLGTYEFVATPEYCRNNVLPKPPAIIFVIDVSYNTVKSGLVNLLCSQMKSIIEHLPCDNGQEKSNMRVGFITFNSVVHFYNIKGTLAAPQMLVVGDTQEMFMPLLDGFLATVDEAGPIIDALMQQIPQMFGDTRETETILLPAILAGLEALKASECAGKLIVFHSTLPTAEAPGKLKNRDDRKLLGTDKERTVLTPQTQAYNQLGQDCVAAGCSVDLFVFNNAYIDIATISQVSRLTGGEVFKYTYFQADIDGDRLISDVITDISRPTAFDAIMRVRTSTGVRPTDFYGHFFMSNTTDIELAAIDCDKAIAVEIKHDDKLSEDEGVYIQSALLYTSCSGQRRLRVINLSLKSCSQMADLYRSCDSDTVINYLAKQSIYKLYDNNPKAVKDNIVTRAAQILATYRKNCASPSSAGQLILPECMKLLPLYVNCLLKSDALSGGSDMTIDDRSFVMQTAMTMDIPTSVNFYYSRLIPIHDIDGTKEPEIPAPIRCTVDKMNEQGVYILENGIHMFLWIGLGASPEFMQKVFDAPSAIQADIERVDLPKLDNPLSLAIRSIIEEIRYQRHRCMRLTIVRQREKMEHVFKHFLTEDRGNDGSPSYVDFLIHLHKEIRVLLS